MLKIQTYLRKEVARKFEEYRKRNNMSSYRASAYLIELGLKVLEENRNYPSPTSHAFDRQFAQFGGKALLCRLDSGLLARLDRYALKRRIPLYQAVQETVELGLKAVEQRGYVPKVVVGEEVEMP